MGMRLPTPAAIASVSSLFLPRIVARVASERDSGIELANGSGRGGSSNGGSDERRCSGRRPWQCLEQESSRPTRCYRTAL